MKSACRAGTFIMFICALLVCGCAKKQIAPQPTPQPTLSPTQMPADNQPPVMQPTPTPAPIGEQNLFGPDAPQPPNAEDEAARLARENARRQFIENAVYFDFDRADLTAAALDVLAEKTQWLADNPNATVFLLGHTDERGTVEYNLALGERRALSVKAFLTNVGIAPERLTTVSYGEEMPADSGQTEQSWAKNRRVEFLLDE